MRRRAMRMRTDNNYYSIIIKYPKENGSFKIEKKRNDYSIIIRGRIITKEDKK